MVENLKKALVTGGAGFIGSHLVDRLISEGFEVFVLDNLFNGKKNNIALHLKNRNFHFIQGDILDAKLLNRIMKKVEIVFHEAAISSTIFSIKDPTLVNNVNINGTLNLLKASLNSNIERFIYASSCAVYGNQDNSPLSENSLTAPISPYAITKLDAERYCDYFHKAYGLETVSLRYFNVYGQRQSYGPYSGVITLFVNRLLKNKPPIIYGNGKQTRDFVHVNDVIEANMLVLKNDNAIGKIFNIASGKSINITTLAEMLIKISGKTNLTPIYNESRLGDIMHSYADISLAKKILNYKPKIDVEVGIAKLFIWNK